GSGGLLNGEDGVPPSSGKWLCRLPEFFHGSQRSVLPEVLAFFRTLFQTSDRQVVAGGNGFYPRRNPYRNRVLKQCRLINDYLIAFVLFNSRILLNLTRPFWCCA